MAAKEVKEIFIDHLKSHSHRITNERFLILDAAMDMNTHFDADELYFTMKSNYINVSRATVYKTLDLMSECDLLTKHHFKGDRTRYETKYGRKQHYHIICVSCNKIVEFEAPRIEQLQDKVCKENNLKSIDHTLQVFATCQEKEKCDNYKSKKVHS